MAVHDHPQVDRFDTNDRADLMIDCLQAVAAVHALLPQMAELTGEQVLVLPSREELRSAYAAASPRAQSQCTQQSVRLAQTARKGTEALMRLKPSKRSYLAPAAQRLQDEIDASIARLFALLPAPR